MERISNLLRINRCLLADCGEQAEYIPEGIAEQQRLMRMLMNIRQPIAADPRFLQAQDEELRQQAADKGIVSLDALPPIGSEVAIRLWQGDITRLSVDAIVNAANAQGLGCWQPLHNCIDNCIHSAAGIQLRIECQRQLQGRLLATAEPLLTPGYNLPARHVIHVVGPIISHGKPSRVQQRQLSDCYSRSLDLAASHGLHSVAFCCISTGVFCFPNRLAAKIAVAAVRRWQKKHPESDITVVFNVFKDQDYDLYRALLG